MLKRLPRFRCLNTKGLDYNTTYDTVSRIMVHEKFHDILLLLVAARLPIIAFRTFPQIAISAVSCGLPANSHRFAAELFTIAPQSLSKLLTQFNFDADTKRDGMNPEEPLDHVTDYSCISVRSGDHERETRWIP